MIQIPHLASQRLCLNGFRTRDKVRVCAEPGMDVELVGKGKGKSRGSDRDH
jgi:hypothetical protein